MSIPTKKGIFCKPLLREGFSTTIIINMSEYRRNSLILGSEDWRSREIIREMICECVLASRDYRDRNPDPIDNLTRNVNVTVMEGNKPYVFCLQMTDVLANGFLQNDRNIISQVFRNMDKFCSDIDERIKNSVNTSEYNHSRHIPEFAGK